MFENWKVTIIGAGTMGHPIAQVFGLNGFETTLVDKDATTLKNAKNSIANNLDNLLKMGEISSKEVETAQELISYDISFEEAAPQANLVIESIYENAQIKRDVFAALDKLCPTDTILASNTSALNIFEIAEVSHPERLIITHWFNPPHIMPLVEVVIGPETSDQTVETVKTLLLELGKTPAVIKQYIPGFIINRINMTILREAGYMVSQGWTTPEDIDAAIIATCGPRFAFEGPHELGDHVGWDLVRAVSSFLFPQLCSSPDPSSLSVDLSSKGFLGVKSGKGFKDYSGKNMEQIQSERNIKIIKMLKAAREL